MAERGINMLDIALHKSLQQFSLDVKLQAGQEVLGILGASGAGKSMLLKCLSGLAKPDEGHILHNHQVFYDAKKKVNLPARDRRIGFLFQNYALFPHMTVARNIHFGLDSLESEQAEARVNDLLNRFHLTDLKGRFPSQLSGGQQQRVALARAMAIEPDILLLDEPLSALDEHLRTHMLEDLQLCLSTFKGSVLYVTHHMEEAYRLCDRIAVMNNGRIVEIGPKEVIFERPVHLETAKITGVKNIKAAKHNEKGQLEVPEWGITLLYETTGENLAQNVLIRPQSVALTDVYAGIRPNRIRLANCEAEASENCFDAWVTGIESTPFRSSVYLKFTNASESASDYNLTWEMSAEELLKVTQLTQPLRICLPKSQVLCLRNE